MHPTNAISGNNKSNKRIGRVRPCSFLSGLGVLRFPSAQHLCRMQRSLLLFNASPVLYIPHPATFVLQSIPALTWPINRYCSGLHKNAPSTSVTWTRVPSSKSPRWYFAHCRLRWRQPKFRWAGLTRLVGFFLF